MSLELNRCSDSKFFLNFGILAFFQPQILRFFSLSKLQSRRVSLSPESSNLTTWPASVSISNSDVSIWLFRRVYITFFSEGDPFCSSLSSTLDLPPPYHSSLAKFVAAFSKMAEDKKTDDYTIEMGKMDQGNKNFEPPPPVSQARSPSGPVVSNSPIVPVLAYCGSSILMTVMNKYVLSGSDFNLNFFLLCVQVCCARDVVSPRDSR